MAIQAILFLFSGLCSQFLSGYATLPQYPSEALPLSALFNNKAAGGHGSVADFDGAGGAYDSQFLPTGRWEYDGLTVGFVPGQYRRPRTDYPYVVPTPIYMGRIGR